jgi:AraC family transcriptional regulator of adaptative response/methylated-DNA-[protein]-cysteine methyltransferase
VWRRLLEIPHGTTTSYEALAISLGQPNAQRAVGKANGDNRIAILIPCHRVIEKSGALRGYGGGLSRKQWLLEHEGAIAMPLFDQR